MSSERTTFFHVLLAPVSGNVENYIFFQISDDFCIHQQRSNIQKEEEIGTVKEVTPPLPCNVLNSRDSLSDREFFQIRRKHSNMSVTTFASLTCNHDRDCRNQEAENRSHKRRSKFLHKEFHAARSLSTVVGVFALCWLPLHIHNVILYFEPKIAADQPTWTTDCAILLSHANSMINPIIYAFHMREMRRAFRTMLKPIKNFMTSCSI